MSVTVLSKSPHLPDSAWVAIALIAVLAGISFLSYLLANVWISASVTTVGFVGYLFDAHLYMPVAVLMALVATVAGRAWNREALRQSGRFGASIRDVVVISAGFLLYEFGRTLTQGDHDTAIANAERVLRVQTALDLPDESRIQAWALSINWLVAPFNTVYSFFFLATTVGVLIWLSFNAPQVYHTTRNAMGVATFSALAFFAFVPLAPPRLTEASGLIDSHARVGLQHGFVNQYAAMPSLHVGWMALMGWALARTIGGTRGRVIGAIPPAVMMLTVVVTGNHYWLDGVVGATLCVVPAVLFDRAATGATGAPVPVPTYSFDPYLDSAETGSALLPISGGEHHDEDELATAGPSTPSHPDFSSPRK